jgi:predicted DNA-binding protein
MTKELYEKVKEKAREKEMTVACYVRQAVINYIERG